MSKSGFKDEVLIKLIVGVVKHVTIDELGPVDYRGTSIKQVDSFGVRWLPVNCEHQPCHMSPSLVILDRLADYQGNNRFL
jgi:hypothetical protein